MIRDLYPHLQVRDAAEAIAFYGRAFGATERSRRTGPVERAGRAELDFGGSTVLLSDEAAETQLATPQAGGGGAATLHLRVDDADAVAARAISAGATLLRALENGAGGRWCLLRDPFGHDWKIVQEAGLAPGGGALPEYEQAAIAEHAQRLAERAALRKVRRTLDDVSAADVAQRRSLRNVLLVCAALLVVAILLLLGLFSGGARPQ